MTTKLPSASVIAFVAMSSLSAAAVEAQVSREMSGAFQIERADTVLPAGGGRVVGERLIGTLSGMAGWAAGVSVRGDYDPDTDAGDPILIAASIAGHIVGSAGGVYLVGRRPHVSASLPATLLGAVVGLGGAVAIASIVGEDTSTFPAALLYALGAPVGATIGFNRSRESIPPVVTRNVNDERIGWPSVGLRRDLVRGRVIPAWVAQVRF